MLLLLPLLRLAPSHRLLSQFSNQLPKLTLKLPLQRKQQYRLSLLHLLLLHLSLLRLLWLRLLRQHRLSHLLQQHLLR
jgi:hypothetical protein